MSRSLPARFFLAPTRHTARLLGAAMFLGAVSSLPAQTTAKDPDAVAHEYADASRRGDWTTVAALMHPDALTQLKATFREIVASDTAHEVAPPIFKLASLSAYDSLSAPEVFKRLMAFYVNAVPGVKEAMAAAEFEQVGHVNEGANLSHVVYRLAVKVGPTTVRRIQVMTLRKDGATWKAELSGELEGLASALSGRPQR